MRYCLRTLLIVLAVGLSLVCRVRSSNIEQIGKGVEDMGNHAKRIENAAESE
jgi:hypothetical protein